MARKVIMTLFTVTCVLLLSSCGAQQASPTPQADMPNPASVYCEENEGTIELRKDASGGVTGFCVFADGSECDEWDYFHGECQPEGAPVDNPTPIPVPTEQPAPSTGAVESRNAVLAYLTETKGNETPAVSLAWVETHTTPADLVGGESYEYTAGDWLITVAYPVVAPESMIYSITVVNQAEGFLWAGEVDAQGQVTEIPMEEEPSDTLVLPVIPTPLPFGASDYQGFWTYTHSEYNFSIMLPEDWVVEETTTSDPLMSGHSLNLHPRLQESTAGLNIRMSFRRVGEESLLWPTGVGAGEFVSQGTLDLTGQPVSRAYFVCPNGQINSIWYQGSDNQANIQRGDLEFGFIFTLTSSYCEGDNSLDLKAQRVGEMIVASLGVP